MQLPIPDEPVQVTLVIDALECYVNLAGPHVHLDGNQIVVLDLPEPSLQKSPAVIAPGQVIEQVTGKTVALVHFDILNPDQSANFSLADVRPINIGLIDIGRIDVGWIDIGLAGHLFPLFYAEERQHRPSQFRAGSQGNGGHAGQHENCCQCADEDAANRGIPPLSCFFVHNTLFQFITWTDMIHRFSIVIDIQFDPSNSNFNNSRPRFNRIFTADFPIFKISAISVTVYPS